MSLMVYKQKVAGECGNYTYLVILNNEGIQITEEQILALPNFLTNERAKNFLSEYIKGTAKMRTIQIAKNWLAKGCYIAGHTARGNFEAGRKAPYFVTFDGGSEHFFVIKKYIPEKKAFLCQNSWGKEYGMNGDFYMKEEDWKYLINPVRVLK